jgi:hypothetical protein
MINTPIIEKNIQSIHEDTPNQLSSGANPLTWTTITFEDDTFRVIPKNIGIAQDLLTSWYNEIEYFAEVETVTIEIPVLENMTSSISRKVVVSEPDYETFTQYDFGGSSLKSNFMNYLPMKIHQLQMTKQLEAYENNVLKIKRNDWIIIGDTPVKKVGEFLLNRESFVGYTSNPMQTSKTETADKEKSKDDEFDSIHINQYSASKSAVTVKVPKAIKTRCDVAFASDFWINPDKKHISISNDFEESPTDFWGRAGPYGMQSCSRYSPWASITNIVENEVTAFLILPKKNKEISVFFNLKAMKTIVYNPTEENVKADESALKLILQTPRCGFVRLFNVKLNDEYISKAIEVFHNAYHTTIDELNQSIVNYHKYIMEVETRVKDTYKHKNEQELINRYLLTTYEISQDLSYKIKSSVLCQEIGRFVLADTLNTQGLNVRLSNYLKELGLQKKRYNDGYYYYGLKPKNVKQSV